MSTLRSTETKELSVEPLLRRLLGDCMQRLQSPWFVPAVVMSVMFAADTGVGGTKRNQESQKTGV